MSPVVKCKECGRALRLDDDFDNEVCSDCIAQDFEFPRVEELNFDQD